MSCITYYLVGVLVVSEGDINYMGGTDYAECKRNVVVDYFVQTTLAPIMRSSRSPLLLEKNKKIFDNSGVTIGTILH